jgi:hypothetical protein
MVSITPRLRQLLLMLSSNQPGEVAAAAAAITRTLEKTGASWHDLVDGLVKDARSRNDRHSIRTPTATVLLTGEPCVSFVYLAESGCVNANWNSSKTSVAGVVT